MVAIAEWSRASKDCVEHSPQSGFLLACNLGVASCLLPLVLPTLLCAVASAKAICPPPPIKSTAWEGEGDDEDVCFQHGFSRRDWEKREPMRTTRGSIQHSASAEHRLQARASTKPGASPHIFKFSLKKNYCHPCVPMAQCDDLALECSNMTSANAHARTLPLQLNGVGRAGRKSPVACSRGGGHGGHGAGHDTTCSTPPPTTERTSHPTPP